MGVQVVLEVISRAMEPTTISGGCNTSFTGSLEDEDKVGDAGGVKGSLEADCEMDESREDAVGEEKSVLVLTFRISEDEDEGIQRTRRKATETQKNRCQVEHGH